MCVCVCVGVCACLYVSGSMGWYSSVYVYACMIMCAHVRSSVFLWRILHFDHVCMCVCATGALERVKRGTGCS
jgi:hypothetical protein